MHTESDYDHDVDLGDLSLSYGKIAQHIPDGARVLDIGCATGSFGLALKVERSCEVTGIEVDAKAAAKATSRGLDVLLADVQSSALAQVVEGRRFDVIVLADVLEHLLEPRALLFQLHEVLVPGGRVLVSVPNITHVDIQLMLAQDNWQYRSSGLLDRTHLRFFSVGTFSEMASACGFDLVAMERVIVPFLGTEVLDFGRGLNLDREQAEALRELVATCNDNFQTYQHILRLEPAPERIPVSAVGLSHYDPLPPAPAGAPRRPAVDLVVSSETGRADLAATLLRALRDQSFRSFAVTVVLRGGDERACQEFREALAVDLADGNLWQVVAGRPSRGEALNAGLALADREYIAFWTDDDAPGGTFLEQLVEVLQAHPWISAAYGTLRISSGEHEGSGWRHLDDLRSLAAPFDRVRMVCTEAVGLSSVLFRVADLRRAGLHFDEYAGGYPEWSFLASLAATHDMELCASADIVSWVHSRRQAPVPGQSDDRHRRLLEAAGERDAALPVRLRRQEVRSAVARLDRLAKELTAREESSRREILTVREQLNRVLGSRSWKLTRGLRRLSRSRLPE